MTPHYYGFFSRLGATLIVLSACSGHGATVPSAYSAPQFQRAESPALTSSASTSFILGDGGPNAAVLDGLSVGADGYLYYATSASFNGSYPTTGEIGRFNFATHAQTFRTVSYAPWAIQETANGSVWVEEWNNASGTPTVDRYAGIQGADTAISIPIDTSHGGFGNGLAGEFAIGADGEVWFTAFNAADVVEINQSTNAVKGYTIGAPPGGSTPYPNYIIRGTDGHLWVTDNDNDVVYRVTSSGASKGANTYASLPEGFPYQSQGITEGSDKKLYIGTLNLSSPPTTGNLDNAPVSSAPAFSSIPLPALGLAPYVLAQVPGKVYFNDITFGSLGIYDIAASTIVVLPTTPSAFGQDMVTDASGKPWLGCFTSSGASCIERVSLTSMWSIYPSTRINLYTSNPLGQPFPPGLIGIGETGNSGPFTVASSDPKVCKAKVMSGFAHDIQVNPVAAGKCMLSVTDAHARTVKVYVTVINGSGNPQTRIPLVQKRVPK